jgi:drug/metabolite transporter (DMT)-like permease
MITLRRTTPSKSVDLALVAVAAAWGSSYLAAKDVVDPDGVVAFLAIRFALAAVGLAIVVAARLRRITRAEVALGVVLGTILSAVLVLETFGITMTSATNAGLIISLTIVMTPLVDRWVRGTHLPSAFYGATAVAVCGVALLVQSRGISAPRLGDLLILLAAAARAVHVTAIAHLSQRCAPDSARVTLVQLCTALSVFVALSPWTGRSVVQVGHQMTWRSWLLTIYLALACTVAAFLVQMWAVRRSSPARVSLMLGTEPLWAAAIGVVLAHDPLTFVGVAGAALVLVGTNWGRVLENPG